MTITSRDLRIYRQCLGIGQDIPVPAELLEAHADLVKQCTAWTCNFSKESMMLLAYFCKKGVLKSDTAVVAPKRGPGRPPKRRQEPVTVE